MIFLIISLFILPAVVAAMSLRLIEDKAQPLVGLLITILVTGIVMFNSIFTILYVEEETIKSLESGKYEVIRTYTVEQADTINTGFKLKKIESNYSSPSSSSKY